MCLRKYRAPYVNATAVEALPNSLVFTKLSHLLHVGIHHLTHEI